MFFFKDRFIYLFIYLSEREHEPGEDAEGKGEADSQLSRELNMIPGPWGHDLS